LEIFKALGLIGIKNSKELCKEKYRELLEEKRIKKAKFLELLKKEYEINGYNL
jgi:hypothetical protein